MNKLVAVNVGKPRDALFNGRLFGENFTIEGLPDDEVCIGDRYRIGTALFEVTQPRTTCYRVGIRMNEPQMAALLTSSCRHLSMPRTSIPACKNNLRSTRVSTCISPRHRHHG